MRRIRLLSIALLALAGSACGPSTADETATPADAEAFVAAAETRLARLASDLERASWVQSTYITHDTEILAAQANERMIAAAVDLAKEATRFDDLELEEDLARKLKLLKVALTLPAPESAADLGELTRIAATMESTYGKGRYCPADGDCLDLAALSSILATSRDPDELFEAWAGWRTVSPAMREGYRRFVELANRGARELGFADLGALWRSKYDMDAEQFAAEVERLWQQVRPLYESLHCYVRARLVDRYGEAVTPAEGPIAAHLLGNMWAQSWTTIYPLVAPADADPGFDLTSELTARGVDEREMVRFGERFFTSLGFEPLPETFWERSLFTDPPDRDVVCHASAWDIDLEDDLRIKMCIQRTAEDFSVIHHELGHNFYQRAYKEQPFLYKDSAHDGFHEGVGDTLALSVTPDYLVEIGLLDSAPDPSKDIGVLLRMALDKVAFLPFGLLVDQWRWQVFAGEVGPDEYNEAWWDLRRRYQGIDAPVARDESQFDPGAKYHVPANTPYTRYFLSHILQFQLQRGLCEAAGYDGPLHRCSIYGNEAAGGRLNAMLEMGMSRPWPEALEAVSGESSMDAGALLDYFAPLAEWLAVQNEGRRCGW